MIGFAFIFIVKKAITKAMIIPIPIAPNKPSHALAVIALKYTPNKAAMIIIPSTAIFGIPEIEAT